MEPEWNDLFVRTSLGETSPIGRTGGFSSPDIIPVGVNPTDPYAFTGPDSYAGFASNEPFKEGAANYVYVRAKNSAISTPASGKAYLALSNPAIVLWPGGDDWTFIKTNNGNYASTLIPLNAPAGTVTVTTDPFVYVPDESGHRCLVTWLSTTSHPVESKPPKITTADDLIAFLQKHLNYAHHNIDIAPSTTGSHTASKPFLSGSTEASWRCGIQVTNCKGFTVSFTSGTPLPDGSYLQLPPQTVGSDATIAILVEATVLPANWNTYINYTYETNGLQPEKFDVQFVSYVDVSERHFAWDFATPYDMLFEPKHLAPAGRRGFLLGTVGLMKGLKP